MTENQHKVYMFIKSYIKKNGYSPLYDEIMEFCEIKHRSNLASILNGLEKQGKIWRNHRKHRCISLTKDKPEVKEIQRLREHLLQIQYLTASLGGTEKEMEKALCDIDWICDLALRPDEMKEMEKNNGR